MSFISGSETWAHFLTFLCLRVYISKEGIKQGLFDRQSQTTVEFPSSDKGR